MLVSEDFLMHYGTPRHSGRYPWGSGKDPFQSSRSFLSAYRDLKKQGLSDVEICRGFGITTTQLRAKKTLARAEQRDQDARFAMKLREKGYSLQAIADRMGFPNESSVRNLLNPMMQEKFKITTATADALKKSLDEKGLLDVGAGVEASLGVSRTKLMASLDLLKEQGYTVQEIYVPQMGGGNKKTTMLVLAPPGMSYADVYKSRYLIAEPDKYTLDGGKTWRTIEPPKQFDGSKVKIRYYEDGGKDKDGVIELRRDVDGLSLGSSHYAQVRIGVDGTHYLKGMAMYSDDIPDGYDIVFNTNKKRGTPFGEVLKKIKNDPDNPFGASIKRQNGYLNIVNEEGDWGEWSRTLASQFVAKQSPSLAKRLLGQTYSEKMEEFETIMSLTNPTIKKSLLSSFADDCDSEAVHLKSASLPRTATHVILPLPDLKPTEVYAPNYKNGEKVVLLRYPHGGIFELPEVTVNNNNRKAKSLLGKAIDAIGIHPKVAEQLSGADFDGDFVMVIPNPRGEIKTRSALKQLEDFEPKVLYKLPDDAPRMSSTTKGLEMGKISNLITDMTIKGADWDEISRAVKHSMVVIDAEKHHLDYKKSYQDYGIAELQKKYQGRVGGGASTLLSKSTSPDYIPKFKEKVDPETGKKVRIPTGETKPVYKVDKATGKKVDSGKRVPVLVERQKMEGAEDAYTLSSGTIIESVYADHANKLKALANRARKEAISTPRLRYSPTAAKTYATEVADLKAALRNAEKASPLERKAQLLADYKYKLKLQDNPQLDKDEKKKLQSKTLDQARIALGSKKERIKISDKEWAAIQAGAITDHALSKILSNTDVDALKERAMPRKKPVLSESKLSRARSMLAKGLTQAEVAEALGVSTTTLLRSL